MRKLLFLAAFMCIFSGCSSKPQIETDVLYPNFSLQNQIIKENIENTYKSKITKQLKDKFNLSDTEIQDCFDNSHFETENYNFDFQKSFDDHQVKVPAEIPFLCFFNVYLWKSEDYTAILDIKNVTIEPFGNFALKNEKNKPSFWFEYFDEDEYKTLDFEESIIVTPFEKPVQIMLGLYGLEVKNMENYQEYKNFSVYIHFSVPNFQIR